MAIDFPSNRDQLVPPQPAGPIQNGDVYIYQGITYTAKILGTPPNESVQWNAATSAGNDGYVLKVGDTMTGQLTLPGGGTGSEAATVDQVTAVDTASVAKAGDTMTGQLTLPGGGTGSEAATVDQVDAVSTASVAKAGDTMTGNLTVPSLNSGPLSGFRNLLINGNFSIWQRGTNGGGVGYQTADRWRLGSNSPNLQRVFPPDSDGIPCGVAGRLTGSAGGALIRQAIELPEQGRRAPFVEGTVWTLSWYSTNASQTAADAAVRFSDDSAGTNQTDFTESNVQTIETLASGWTRYSVNYTAPAGFTGSNACAYVQIAGPSDGSAVDFTGIQFEPGLVATPLEIRPIATELMLCQRYFYTCSRVRLYPSATSTTGRLYEGPRPVTMRALPDEAQTSASSITFPNSTASTMSLSFAGAAAGSGAVATDYTADAEL